MGNDVSGEGVLLVGIHRGQRRRLPFFGADNSATLQCRPGALDPRCLPPEAVGVWDAGATPCRGLACGCFVFGGSVGVVCAWHCLDCGLAGWVCAVRCLCVWLAEMSGGFGERCFAVIGCAWCVLSWRAAPTGVALVRQLVCGGDLYV